MKNADHFDRVVDAVQDEVVSNRAPSNAEVLKVRKQRITQGGVGKLLALFSQIAGKCQRRLGIMVANVVRYLLSL